MIAATSPHQLHRSKQPLVSEHMQGRKFARSGPPVWEIGRLTATHGSLPNPEDRDVAIVLRETQRDLYRVGHPPQPRKNGSLDWKHWASNEAPSNRPSESHWGRPANAPHARPSPPTWTFHPRVPTDMSASENSNRRAYQPSGRGYYASVQHQQQWHRFLEARHNGMLERNTREGMRWSTSGAISNPVISSSAEPVESLLRQQGVSHKRPLASVQMNSSKRPAMLNKLDLLCSATLEIGPLHDNPMGCSCPKSKCVALYCDCFKAGRRCNPSTCSCLDCKNTVAESGPHGARTAAIRSILARNPRAFQTAGCGAPKIAPGQIACNCIRSRCLKLYCSCFQNGKPCDPNVCTCVDCYNTSENPLRKQAVELCLEKRPDAFATRTREPGLGCACKNNRCIRKYCDCFRSNLPCSERCSCRHCANTDEARKLQNMRDDELKKKNSVESQESSHESVSV